MRPRNPRMRIAHPTEPRRNARRNPPLSRCRPPWNLRRRLRPHPRRNSPLRPRQSLPPRPRRNPPLSRCRPPWNLRRHLRPHPRRNPLLRPRQSLPPRPRRNPPLSRFPATLEPTTTPKPEPTAERVPATRLTDNGAWEGLPAWSPDGRRIAFELRPRWEPGHLRDERRRRARRKHAFDDWGS